MSERGVWALVAVIMFLCTVQVASAAGLDDARAWISCDNANTTGTTALDVSGTPLYNGTITTATTGSTGYFNQAYSYDGTNDYLTMTNNIFNSSTAYTLVFWINPTTIDAGGMDILAYNSASDGGLGKGFIINCDTDLVGGNCQYYVYTDGANPSIKFTLATGAWNQVVLTGKNADRIRVYVNGTHVSNATFASNFQDNGGVADAVYLMQTSTGTRRFPGTLDEIGFYDYEFTDANVTNAFNLTRNPYAPAPAPPANTINISIATPLNNTNHNLNPVLNTLMVNSSADFECNLSLNGVVNQSGTYSSGTNVNVSFNLTFTSNGRKNITWACNNTNDDTDRTTGFYWFDDINPNIVTAYENGTIFYDENVTGQFNLSDDVYLHSLLITLWNGTVLTNLTGINATSYQYNLSFDPGGYLGTRTFTLRLADGHTAQELKSQDDWKISNGLFNDKLSVDWRGEYKPVSMTLRGDGGIWDSWDYKEEKDRVSFTYEPAKPAKTHTLTLTADERLDIVSAPWTEYKNWVIIDDHWVDFQPYDINVIRISDREARVIVQNPGLDEVLKFHSAGDLNIITKNYTFTNINISETYTNPLYNYYETTHTINITGTNTSPTSYALEFNNTNYTTSMSITKSGNWTSISRTSLINLSIAYNASIPHKWYLEYPITNVSTSAQNQTVYTVNIGLCEGNTTDVIANFSYYDEKDLSGINLTNEYDIRLTDGTYSYLINGSWNYSHSNQICTNIPSSHAYNFAFTGETMTLSKTDYITRLYELSGISGTLSNNPVLQQKLYLLKLNDSSTVNYNWYTDSYQTINGIMLIYKCTGANRTLVESAPIIDGIAVANIELLTQPYAYEIIYEGTTYTDTTSYSKCHLESQTDITYYVDVGEETITEEIGLFSVQCTLENLYNNTYRLNWTQNPDDSSYVTGCIQAFRPSNIGNVIVFENCSDSGYTFTQDVTGLTPGFDYIIRGKLEQGDQTGYCTNTMSVNNPNTAASAWGASALFAVLLIVAGLILMYAGDGIAMHFGAMAALILGYVLGLTQWSFLTLTSLLLFMLIIVGIGRYNK